MQRVESTLDKRQRTANGNRESGIGNRPYTSDGGVQMIYSRRMVGSDDSMTVIERMGGNQAPNDSKERSPS